MDGRFPRWGRVGGMLLMLSACQPQSAETPLPLVIPARGDEVAAVVRAASAPVVLVNLWATWCVPCREEFPDLVRLQRAYRDRGLKVLFVSWDADPAEARAFLAAQGVEDPSYIKSDDQNDPAFIEALEPAWSGAFPTTLIYDARGGLKYHWEGKRTYAEFEQAVREVLEGSVTRSGSTP